MAASSKGHEWIGWLYICWESLVGGKDYFFDMIDC